MRVLELRKKLFNNRWMALISCSILMLCAAITFIWSLFVSGAMEYFHISSGTAALPFNVTLTVSMLGIVAGGRICDQVGCKKPMIVGVVLYLAGVFLASLAGQTGFVFFFICFCIVGGVGGGLIYVATVSCVQKWWTGREGIASGTVLSMNGVAAILFTPIITAMLEADSIGFILTFRYLAYAFTVIYAVILALFSFGLDGPEGMSDRSAERFAGAPEDKNVKRNATKIVLKTPAYYILFAAVLLLLPAYYTITPLLKTIGTERGLSDGLVTFTIMGTGFASAAGRFVFAKLCDNFESKNILTALCAATAAAILLLSRATGLLFVVMVFVVTFAYGGSSGITPSLAAEYFDRRIAGTSYGMLILPVLVSCLGSPVVVDALKSNGSLSALNFLVPAVGGAVGVILSRVLRHPKQPQDS